MIEPASGAPAEGLAIYVHYPFCARRCPYCDFNVAVQASIPHAQYREAILAELAIRAPQFSGPSVSLYFGGGTPALWPAEEIGRVIEGVRASTGLVDNAEITVECNPGEIRPEGFAALRAVGVNRLSLGTQSFDDQTLAALGRRNRAEDNRRAVMALQAAGFENFSLDLIQGISGQTVEGALEDVERTLELGPAHISTYQLTIAPQTPFGARAARGEVLTVPDDAQLAIYEGTRDKLAEAGIEPYEIANAGRAGWQAVHNSAYWVGLPYMALGAGAHGFNHGVGAEGRWGVRWENTRHPSRYMEAALSGEPGETFRELLTEEQLDVERIMTGLRLDRGLRTTERLRARYGTGAEAAERRGWLWRDEGLWRLSPRGRALLDTVLLTIVDV
ncbi:MAG: radical SAM family heme chaperone HemW [Bradymonadia bacterium]